MMINSKKKTATSSTAVVLILFIYCWCLFCIPFTAEAFGGVSTKTTTTTRRNPSSSSSSALSSSSSSSWFVLVSAEQTTQAPRIIDSTTSRTSLSLSLSSTPSSAATTTTTTASEELANTMSENESSKKPSATATMCIDGTPYSDDEMKRALESLLRNSEDPVKDSRHLYGHFTASTFADDNDNNNTTTTILNRKVIPDKHNLSMLQVITATRILDYQNGLSQKHDSAENLEMDYTNVPRLNLQQVVQTQNPKMALAAEFKRASPSKGDIAVDLNAGEQGRKYANAGADIISVLTESRWFKGNLRDLQQVRKQTTKEDSSRPAILRKDFVVSRWMIDEAAKAGADTVLLIVAVLPRHLLQDLIDYSRSQYGMEPLVEVHANIELQVAVDAGAKVIGVNNRNLHTFSMDMTTTNRIAEQISYQGLEFHHNQPTPDYTLCALSGMSNAFQVDRYRQVGVGMCLVGESLMRASNPISAIKALCLHPKEFDAFLSSSSSSSSITTGVNNVDSGDGTAGAACAYTGGTKIVKVCGITNPADAVVACRSGANLVGVIFATKSKRKVSPARAKEIVDTVRAFGERSQRIEWNTIQSMMEEPIPHFVMSSNALVDGTASNKPAVVGVFQNQSPDFIKQMVDECGLDLVQLHGSEGMEAANAKSCGGVPAIRVMDIATDPDTGKASETAVEKILETITNDPIAILLDTSIKGQKDGGGTGVAFDWSIAQQLQNSGLPVLIAGGLTPNSIQDCVSNTRPFGVDVSSGVEKEPGRKDHDKVKAFIRGAKQAAEDASEGF